MSDREYLQDGNSDPVEGKSADDLQVQIDWIRQLVAFDTTSRNPNLALVEHLESYLESLGISSHRVSSPNGDKANLYTVVGPHVPGGVILSGHTDVVPVDGQNWHTDPWTLTEKDGKLYGRGTCDMKSFCAIGLSLVPDMLAAGLRRPIIFAFSYDEEVGCLGAPSMISEIVESVPRPLAVIVGEPTEMKLVGGHKGIGIFRTAVKGYTTHSSQTDRGISAVEVAGRLISKIAAMREVNAARANADSLFDPPYSTMTVNLVNGGTQTNIMAAECYFEWDIRTIPNDSTESILAEFEAYARDVAADMQAKVPGCSIVTEQLGSARHLAPQDSSVAIDLVKAITRCNRTETLSYASEAGQFQEAGFSTVICGPGSIDQAHQANEFISIEQVAKGVQFMRDLIDYLAVESKIPK